MAINKGLSKNVIRRTLEDDIEVTRSDLTIELRGRMERGAAFAMGLASFETTDAGEETGRCTVADPPGAT